MKKIEFADKLGVTPSYVTQLCRVDYPWVSRDKALLIAEITKGEVTPNDLCGYDPSQAQTG
jgi:3,4-dihydroxy 2-butanone 4-phosphate synthase/GTP cyclohydrolase II